MRGWRSDFGYSSEKSRGAVCAPQRLEFSSLMMENTHGRFLNSLFLPLPSEYRGAFRGIAPRTRLSHAASGKLKQQSSPEDTAASKTTSERCTPQSILRKIRHQAHDFPKTKLGALVKSRVIPEGVVELHQRAFQESYKEIRLYSQRLSQQTRPFLAPHDRILSDIASHVFLRASVYKNIHSYSRRS